MQKTTPQTITGGFNETIVTFDEIGYDTGGLVDLDNDQLIVPANGRRIQLASNLQWDFADHTAVLADSMRCVIVEALDKDGNSTRDNNTVGTPEVNAQVLRLQTIPGMTPQNITQQISQVVSSVGHPQSFITAIMDVEPGDRFKLRVNHNDGHTIDITNIQGNLATVGYQRATWFSMIIFG